MVSYYKKGVISYDIILYFMISFYEATFYSISSILVCDIHNSVLYSYLLYPTDSIIHVLYTMSYMPCCTLCFTSSVCVMCYMLHTALYYIPCYE